jgi:hypothetical protein
VSGSGWCENCGVNRYAWSAKGTLEYGSATLFVADITLRGGAIVVTATGWGPAPRYSGPLRLHGPDGLLVAGGGHFDVETAGRLDAIKVELTLTPDPEAST